MRDRRFDTGHGPQITESLPEVIYRDLSQAILRGVYAPGAVLRQEELARRYGVSRVPVREAMSRLAAEGLVVARPRRGYAVTSLDLAAIEDVFGLRSVVEEYAGRMATEKRTPADVEEVAALLAELEALDTEQREQRQTWLDLNRRFHERLFRAGRRPHLSRMCEVLRDMVEPYIRLEVKLTGQLQSAQDDHRAIVEAFRAADAPRVARLCREHCENTAARLLHGLPHAAPSDQSDNDTAPTVSAANAGGQPEGA